MAVKTWTHGSGNWSAGPDWSPTLAPVAGDTVIIGGTVATGFFVTFNSTFNISSLTVSNANATLVSRLATNALTFTVSGNTTLSAGNFTESNTHDTFKTGSLTISSSTSTFTQSLGSYQVTTAGTSAFAESAGNASFSGGTFTDAGGFALSGGTLTDSTGGSVAITGVTALSTGGALTMAGGSFTSTGGITFASTSGGLTGKGTVTGALSGTAAGVVQAAGGTLDLTSNIGASTGLNFQINSGILQLDGSVGAGNTFSFLTTTGNILYNSTGGITETLVALNVGSSASTPTNFIDYRNHTVTISGSNVGSGTSGTINLSDGSVLSLSGATNSGSGWFVDATPDSSGGTDVFLSSVVCYAAGTRMLTADGERLVEDIAEGDMVVTLLGGQHVSQPVKWIGERRINIAAHPRPELVAPVRIRSGAFGEGLPRRDLVVSPDHCLFVDGKLIPAKLLINDMTIVQERDARSVHYFHLELDRHAVLLAEGLPAESYLDTGNRAYFSNSGLAMVLHPEFHVNAGLKCWDEDACAPLAVSPSAVEPVWRELAARAASLGHSRTAVATTDDADLRLIADGRTIRPVSVQADRHVFVLPAGVSEVRLASRAAIPSDSAAYLDDWRRLGVAVKRIVVRTDSEMIDIAADHPTLEQGWYKVERDDASIWRWMDGDARLPIAMQTDPVMVEVHVGITTAYRLHDTADASRLAA